MRMGFSRLVLLFRPSGIVCNSAISSLSSYPSFFHTSSPNVLVFFFSSSSAALQNPSRNHSNSNLVFEFLLRDCGFAQSRLAVLQKRHPLLWKRTSVEKARQTVDIFRSYGFSDSQLETLLVRYPFVLSFLDAEVLRTKFKIVESFGFPKEDIADVLSRSPNIIYAKDLDRVIQTLLSAFGNSENFRKAVEKRPVILAMSGYSLETQINSLRQAGFDDHTISSLIYRCPAILQTSSEKMLRIIKCLRDIGVPEESRVFQTAFVCAVRGGWNLDQTERVLATFGLSEEQIKEVFRKCPANLSKSTEKIRKVMDYLVSVAGLSPDVIVKYPKILGLSIEKRIKPRHEAFKYVSAVGGSGRFRSVGRFIEITEKKFIKTVVEGNPDAEKLLKISGTASSTNGKRLGQSSSF